MARQGPILAVSVFALLSIVVARGESVCPDGALYSDNGKVAGCLRQGVRVGVWRMRDGRGNVLQEVSYNDAGEQDGMARTYFPNGAIKEESVFKRNRPDGVWTAWYENAQKREERFYADGELHGPRAMWNEDGSPNGLRCFVRGKPKALDACSSLEVVRNPDFGRAPASTRR